MTLFELLEGIRKKPAMYLGRESLHDLWMFLLGYEFRGGLPEEEMHFFRDFDNFVQKKYHWVDTGGWCWKILYYNRNDEGAFKEFFKLYDEWRNNEKK